MVKSRTLFFGSLTHKGTPQLLEESDRVAPVVGREPTMYADDRNNDDESIDYERSTFEHGAKPWKDPAVLRKLYHGEEMTQGEIAGYFDTVQQNISHWMNKLDVETRTSITEKYVFRPS